MTVEQTIEYEDQTNWIESDIVEFEIDLTCGGHTFKYQLHIEQTSEIVKPRIVKEQAICDGKSLFQRNLDGEILNTVGEHYGSHLWRANHSSPTRHSSLQAVEGLTVSETIARGWVNA